MPEELKVPSGALKLIDTDAKATVSFKESEGGEKKVKTFRMVGYSGGIIKNHWWWDNLLIDLAGMSFPKGKYPILRDHNTNRELAYSSKPVISNEGLVFTENEVTFLDTDEANKFLDNAKAGFPYQASISVNPSVIERISEGATGEANGLTVKGPATIFRKTVFKECSVCVFGYDSQTSASAFSGETDEVVLSLDGNIGDFKKQIQSKEDTMPFDLTQFKKDNPEAFAEIVEDAQEKVKAEFSVEKQTLDDQITSLKEENKDLTIEKTTLQQSSENQETRLKALEKDATIRFEKDLDSKADTVWETKLSVSDIDPTLYDKVSKMVSRKSFMKEGQLDEEAFTEAVVAEVADWETKLGEVSSPVQGVTNFSKIVTDDGVNLANDDDETVDRMLSYAHTVNTNETPKQ